MEPLGNRPQFLSIPPASIPEARLCSEPYSIFFVQLPSEFKCLFCCCCCCCFVFTQSRDSYPLLLLVLVCILLDGIIVIAPCPPVSPLLSCTHPWLIPLRTLSAKAVSTPSSVCFPGSCTPLPLRTPSSHPSTPSQTLSAPNRLWPNAPYRARDPPSCHAPYFRLHTPITHARGGCVGGLL